MRYQRNVQDRWAILSVLLAACLIVPAGAVGSTILDTVAFGSCADQSSPQPIWNAIAGSDPDLFVFMGDTVYADTTDMDRMRGAYDKLAAKPGFRALKESVPMIATWDDHDYGANDAGADYPAKEQSAKVFLDFFDVPERSPRRSRPGIYGAYAYGPPARRVRVILLDTRSFRSPLVGKAWQYRANRDPEATILGERQWQWLARELGKPAQLRLLVSSIQVIPDQHGWEKWGNFPLERKRLFHTIRAAGAEGVVILSGDRHHGELSRLPGDHEDGVGYPLYEITASGLNNAIGMAAPEPNRYRRHDRRYRDDHFGLLRIDWESRTLRMAIADEAGESVRAEAVSMSALTPGTGDAD